MSLLQSGQTGVRLRSFAAVAGPSALVVLLVVMLVPIGASSMIGAAMALSLTAGLCLVLAVGLERTAVVLFVIGIALSPLDRLRPVAALSFASLSDLVIFVALAVLIPVLATRSFPRESVYYIGAGGLFVVGVITSVISTQPIGSLAFLMRLVIGALVLPFAFSMWRPRREILLWFASAYVVGNLINLVFAYTLGSVDFGRRYGYSTHPNVMGLAAMLGFALCPFLWAALPKAYRWMVLVAAGGCALNVWVSGSRAALIVAAAVVVLYVVMSRSVGIAVALFGAAIPVFYVVAQAYINKDASNDNALGRLFGGGSADSSDLQREELARVALKAFHDHPVLGQGLAEVMEAHNIYLQIAAAVGLVGGAFYLVLLGSVVLRAARLSPVDRLLVLPCMGYAMIGAMTTILWDRYVWCVLALPFLLPVFRRDDVDDATVPLIASSELTPELATAGPQELP